MSSSATPVTVGLLYDFRNPHHEPWVERYEALFEQIESVDRELPIDGVHVTEHHFYEDGYMPSPLLVLGTIAGRTKRVSLGTNIVQLPLHHPVRIAEDSLVLDVVSGGRFRLGLGAGYYWREFQGLGANVGHRPSRMTEGMELLQLAFRGEAFAYEGKRFDVPEILVTPPPIRPGGPEMWVGAFVPDAIDRLARIADGFIAFGHAGIPEYLAACERHGRPPQERQLNRTYWAIIDEDPERALAESAGPGFIHMFNDYIRREAYPGFDLFEDVAPGRAIAEENGFLLLTDAAGAIEALNADIAMGARDINLLHWMPGEDAETVNARVQYLCDRVIPHLDPVAEPGRRLTRG